MLIIKFESSEVLSTLKINKIDLNDVGNYTCVAKNTFGSDSQAVYLNIKGIIHFYSNLICYKLLNFVSDYIIEIDSQIQKSFAL